MEYSEINKTTFKNEYNIDKILVKKSDIMEYLKTYKEKNNMAVAFAYKKQHRVTLEDIMVEIVGINKRLDNIVKLNNLKE